MKAKIEKELKKILGEDFYLEFPPEWVKADFSTSFPLKEAKKRKKAPVLLAEELKEKLKDTGFFAEMEFLPPGFLNLKLSREFVSGEFAEFFTNRKTAFGFEIPGGSRIIVEAVSANPTGPLHIGHGRGGVIGDVLVRIYRYMGYEVDMEYYVNDRGRQMRLLGESLKARYEKKDLPEDGYKGEYLVQIAEGLKERPADFTRAALESILSGIREELSRFGIVYDRYFFETSLYAGGVIEEMKKQMKEKDLIFEEDGALWFRATRYGDDKDRVLVKKDGESTYFLSDIAYHYEKYRRGYALCINVWGADHHGYVKRLEGAVEALGRGKENFHVVLYQLVRLLRKGEPVVMSTRAGEFVTLEEVMREVGTDVTRFYLLLRKTTSHLDFDLEKAKEESMDNPVYYLQYAHARISSVFQKARERDLSCDFSGADFRNLEDDREKELMKKILFFPDVLVRCGEEKEPYYLVEYLLGLAQVFHNYYNNSRFLEHPDRLALIDGLKYVLASGLSLLGIKPMEKM